MLSLSKALRQQNASHVPSNVAAGPVVAVPSAVNDTTALPFEPASDVAVTYIARQLRFGTQPTLHRCVDDGRRRLSVRVQRERANSYGSGPHTERFTCT